MEHSDKTSIQEMFLMLLGSIGREGITSCQRKPEGDRELRTGEPSYLLPGKQRKGELWGKTNQPTSSKETFVNKRGL